MRRSFALAVLFMVATVPGSGRADPPGFALSLSGPAEYTPGVPVTFSGVLTVAGAAGLPLQPVTIVVDGSPVASTSTATDGSYSQELTFDASEPYSHAVLAVANQGTLLATSSPTLTITRRPPPKIVINEVDYDQPGTDSAEFIEIYNPTSSPADLNGIAVVLINGANNTEYQRVALSGTLPVSGYAVVKDPGAPPVPAGTLVFSFAGASDQVQNGAPDGIALFDVSSNKLLDALSYEGAITAAVINGAPGTYSLTEGTATTAADDNISTAALARVPNGVDTDNAASDWTLASKLTPGSTNS